jgi:hypothetical protein
MWKFMTQGGFSCQKYSQLCSRYNYTLTIQLWVFFFSTGIWTQGLHLEPLYQPFFCDEFFWDRVSRTICLSWLQTMILLISASGVARITGVSRWRLAYSLFLDVRIASLG